MRKNRKEENADNIQNPTKSQRNFKITTKETEETASPEEAGQPGKVDRKNGEVRELEERRERFRSALEAFSSSIPWPLPFFGAK